VRGLTFSPDGRYVASSSADRSVKVWEVSTAAEHATLQGHNTAVTEAAFSPGGDLIATVSDDQTLRLWDAHTGQPLQVIHPNLGNLIAVAFSPDGTRLAVGSGIPEYKVGLFHVTVPHVRRRLGGHQLRNLARVASLTFHPRDALLASGGADQKVILHDVSKGRPVRTWNTQPDNPVGSLAFSPDGELLATAPSVFMAITPKPDLGVYLLETRTGEVRRRLLWQRPEETQPSNPAHVGSTAFDPTGKRLAAGGTSLFGTGRVLVWEVPSGDPVQRWQFPKGIRKVAFVAGDRQLVAGDIGGRIRLLDVATGGTLREATVPASADLDLVLVSEGRQVIVAAQDTLYVFRLPDLELTATRKTTHTGSVTRIAVSGDGRLLASGGSDRQVILWDAQSLDRLAVLPPHSSDVESLALSSDRSRLAVGGRDEFVTLWDLSLLRKALTELTLDWR
jgi:WD40 repeat protein